MDKPTSAEKLGECASLRISDKKCAFCSQGYSLNEASDCVENEKNPHCDVLDTGDKGCERCKYGFYMAEDSKCVENLDFLYNYTDYKGVKTLALSVIGLVLVFWY